MTTRISVLKTGLGVAAVLGGWHLCWSILVATTWAQAVADFIFWMHFIKPVYVIEPFTVDRAAMLLVVTTAIGFVFGSVFAWVWNAVHRTKALE